MAAIELTGRITEQGKLELELPAGWKPGTVHITIEPIDPEQAWFWTPEWQAKEKKVDEEFAAGEHIGFDTIEDFIAHLKNAANDTDEG